MNNMGAYSRTSSWLKDKKRPFFISIASIFTVVLVICFIDLGLPGQVFPLFFHQLNI